MPWELLPQEFKRTSDAFHTTHEAARIEGGVPRAVTILYCAGRSVADLKGYGRRHACFDVQRLGVKVRSELAWAQVNRDDGYMRERPAVLALFEKLTAMDVAPLGGGGLA